mgnify:FL=1
MTDDRWQMKAKMKILNFKNFYEDVDEKWVTHKVIRH